MSNPLGEVFGFPITNVSERAERYRSHKLCPYNNVLPNCTKDKQSNPLGVCSMHHRHSTVITCPVRFREDWLILDDVYKFFFEEDENWTSLGEVKIKDASGKAAGNIDYVLVTYDKRGRITNFASLEVQAVYVTGNIRDPFEAYMDNPTPAFEWTGGFNYPKPDYLSSSRKRLAPQLLSKGGIFNQWGKKQAVVLQTLLYDTLPPLTEVEESKATLAWFLYDLVPNENGTDLQLTLNRVVYTMFESALVQFTTFQAGDKADFVHILQSKLDEKLAGTNPATRI